MSASRVDVDKLLKALGLVAFREGRKWRASCPHPDHPHPPGKVSTPSWSMKDDENAGSHHCFGCGFGGGPWELVAAVRGLTLEEAGKWVHQELGGLRPVEEADLPLVRISHGPLVEPFEMDLPQGVQIPSVDGSEWFAPAWDYLTGPVAEKKRGVAAWQLARWHIGFALWGRLSMRVVVPVYTRRRLLSYVARAFVGDIRRYDVASKKVDRGARPEVALFGEPGWDPNVSVATVAEGIFGMLNFERAEAPNPTGILGAENLGPEKIDMLSRFELVLVGTDPDFAGDRSFEKIHDALCRYTEVRRVPLIHKPDDAPTPELRDCWRAAMTRRRRVWPTAPPPSGR